MDINCQSWNDDFNYLSGLKNVITTATVYTQALIHSNLFDANLNRRTLTNLTLCEMAEKKYKKPFVCTIIEGIYFD